MTHPEDGEVKDLVDALKEAVGLAYNEERPLLIMEGVERPFVFRIGCYLNQIISQDESRFEKLDLDCEYNKNMGGIKSTERFLGGIYPDLLLHQRNSNDKNIMAIEFKGHWAGQVDDDLKKLEDLTNSKGLYKYTLGVFVVLGVNEPKFRFFQNGNEISLKKIIG